MKNKTTGDGGSECANFETCGKQTRMFCPLCNMFICDSCDPSHTSSIFTRNHKRCERDGVEGRGGRRRLEEEGGGGGSDGIGEFEEERMFKTPI